MVRFIVNAREPALGVGVLVRKSDEDATYKFVNGGERTFKHAYCRLYIKRAFAVSPEIRSALVPPPPPVARAPRLPEIEEQIRANPDDPEPYLIYADWLQQRRDPRGELITVQYQRAAAPSNRRLAAREKALFKQHPNLLPRELGEALSLQGNRCEVTWHCGFMSRLRIANGNAKSIRLVDVLDGTLIHPSARFLRSIELGPLGTPSYAPLLKMIAQARNTQLDELVVGDFGDLPRVGDLVPVLKATPVLTKLVVRAGTLRFGSKHVHERLESLTIESHELRLDVTRWHYPRLRHLAVRGTRETGALLDALAESPMLARLETLRLDGGDVDDDDVRRVMKRRDRFAHLRVLDLSSPQLSAETARWLGTR
jgi:uncharacterized protein (TIGR02996 family)